MTLIVETGLGVANANSYVDIPFIRAYALDRRITLPADDVTLEAFAIGAMDAIEARTYKGRRTFLNQSLSFPRVGVVTDDGEYDANVIPSTLKRAQAQLVAYRASGIDLMPSGNAEPAIKRDKVGPLETEYFENAGSLGLPSIPLADVLLSALERGQGKFGLRTVRV